MGAGRVDVKESHADTAGRGSVRAALGLAGGGSR